MAHNLNIAIWSDIVCPFCYIGKRHLETALLSLGLNTRVHVEWKSFQLDPDLDPVERMDVYTYLAQRYGKDLAWSVAAHNRVVQMAKEAGLSYDFSKTVVANSFDAHRLIHLAHENGKSAVVTESLFQAYFSEGKDIADHGVLVALADSNGLDRNAVEALLATDRYSRSVQQDSREARELGIAGVPFFLVNGKIAVSGAQPVEVFKNLLNEATGA